jgi:6-phosphofructokinase 2
MWRELLENWEVKRTAIFPSGGYTGKFFNHLLEKEGVPAVIIESANETREKYHCL